MRSLLCVFLLAGFAFQDVYSGTEPGVESSIDMADSSEKESFILEKEPELIEFVKLEYPSVLSRKGIEGTVTVDLLVNKNGDVDSVALINGVHPELDRAVMDAVRRFRFSPAEADGKKVPVIITYQYTVALEDVLEGVGENVNFTGFLYERGTRTPVTDADVAVFFTDTLADSSLNVPFSVYINQIGRLSGQSLEQGSITTVSDSSGKFSFKSLPCGPVRVRVSAAGCEPFEMRDTVACGEVTEVVYRLQRTSYSDLEIVVYGRTESREVSRRSLSRGEVRKIPGFSGDAVKVVQALPGVGRSSFGGGSIRVRGAPTWDSKFYLDGVSIPMLYHFGGIKSTYNSEALESVDLYPGGYSSRYGNSVAGVIELQSRNADRQRAKGFADVNLFDATFFAEGPIGSRGGILANVRRSYFGDILGVVVKKIGDKLNMPISVVPYYYDYTVRADVDLDAGNKLFMTLFGSKDELKMIVPFMRGGSSEVDQMVDRLENVNAFNMATLGWDFSAGRWVNSLRAAVVQREGLGSIFGYAKWTYKAWEYLLRAEASCKISPQIKLTTGTDLWLQPYYHYAVFPRTDKTFFRDTMKTTFGLIGPYLQLEYNPIPDLYIIPGLRYDYYPELLYRGSIVPEFWDYRKIDNEKGPSGEPSVRLSAGYKLNSRHSFKAAVGSYSQTPQPMGFTIHDTVGNPMLPATKASHITGGYQWKISDLLYADVQIYRNTQWDIPELATPTDMLNDQSTPGFLDWGRARMYGLELMLRHEQSERFFGWIAYTLSRSERWSRRENRYIPYTRDQTHNLQLILSYKLPKEWQAGTKVRYISGNPFTPVADRVFNITNRIYEPKMGRENSARNDPFFQVDFRVDKKIIYDKWMMSFYLDLQNVLWFMYKSPELTIYNYDYTEQISVTSPFIPSFGLKVEF